MLTKNKEKGMVLEEREESGGGKPKLGHDPEGKVTAFREESRRRGEGT